MALRFVACLLFALALPSFAGALPVVAGFGDSITCDTSSCGDGSYLGLLGVYLEPDPIIDDNGVSASRTGAVLARLTDWINGEGDWLSVGPQTADVVVLLTGTPDTYQHEDYWNEQNYSPVETLGNIEGMIDLLIAQSIPLVLVAPPPVLDPCANPDPLPTCSEIDTSLANLSSSLASLASTKTVPFVDLYQAFMDDDNWGIDPPDPNSLYVDGLHPRLETGDDLIASLVAFEIQAIIPEPSTAVLLASGLLALAHRQRRRSA